MTKEVKKVDGRKSVIKRDDNGLMPDQVKVLEALSNGVPPQKLGDIEEGIGIEWKRVRRWLRDDEPFTLAWDTLFGTTLANIQRQSVVSSEKAMDTLDELTEAMKPVTKSFNCQGCGMRNTVQIIIPDAQVRKSAAETILKTSGAMKELIKSEVDVKVDVTSRPDVWQTLDLMRFHRGKPLAPGVLEDLIEAGFLEQKDRGGVIEGEFREVEEEQDGNDGTSDVQHDASPGVQPPDGDPSSPV